METMIKDMLDKIPYVRLPNVGLSDIIDILVVAYLIYILLVWIKDTRTWALFKGVGVILVVAIIAYFFRLHTLWWIISNTITVGAIALIIVFQPELRRALEQIGRGKIFNLILSPLTDNNSSDGELTNQSIEEIARACVEMAKYKTGALIVFEQESKLGDIERSGIKIDAEITSQLLINIFEKNTPLHDGAVVIKDNRISSSTCFLPLSDNLEISKALGTRHRAAIGISEGTDAIVLVVSEETGTISYVRGGKIKRGLDGERIKQLLIATKKKKKSENKLLDKKVIWKERGKHE